MSHNSVIQARHGTIGVSEGVDLVIRVKVAKSILHMEGVGYPQERGGGAIGPQTSTSACGPVLVGKGDVEVPGEDQIMHGNALNSSSEGLEKGWASPEVGGGIV